MSRATAQARWRTRHAERQQRIEVVLPTATVTALDRLAAGEGTSRGAVIAALIAEASAAPDSEPKTLPVDSPETSPAGEPKSLPVDAPATTGRTYRLRRPRADERACEWIVVVDGESVAEVERYPDTGGWRGRYLKTSLTWRWCKRKTRDATVRELLAAPDIYR